MGRAGAFGARYTTEDPPEDPAEDPAKDAEPVECWTPAGIQLAMFPFERPAPRPAAPCPAFLQARLQALRLEAWVSAELHRRMAPQVWI